jgi:hypothetical protein
MSKKWLVALISACVLVAGTSAQAADGSIGVYLDASGTQCSAPFSGPIVIGSVWMNLDGSTAAGMTGVEFRIDNTNTSAYAVSFSADGGAAAVLGNPMIGGCNVAFASCQTGTAGRVHLGDLYVTENSAAADVVLTVRQHYTPSNDVYACPLATLCDDPVFTAVCLSPSNSDMWRSVINPTGLIAGDCVPVAVAPATWTQVKSIFAR